jgi:hypothetical protein
MVAVWLIPVSGYLSRYARDHLARQLISEAYQVCARDEINGPGRSLTTLVVTECHSLNDENLKKKNCKIHTYQISNLGEIRWKARYDRISPMTVNKVLVEVIRKLENTLTEFLGQTFNYDT